MTSESLRHATRRANLLLVLEDPRIGGPAELARRLGNPKMKSHLSNLKAGKRGIGDALAQQIEDAAEKPRGWMDQQHAVTGEKVPTYQVAHDLSHPIDSDDLPLMPWEALSTVKAPPEIFRTVLFDDAMAPDLPRGAEVVWTTRRRIAPGRVLLLRDAHGQLHVRLCHQGRAPGQWLAVATNSAFVSFDSTEPGLTVMAVYKGRLEPDDE